MMKRKPKWIIELREFLYLTKRERDGFLIFEIILLGMLAHKIDMIKEFNLFMFIGTPIIFLICSILNYREKKKEIEKIKNYVDDEADWEDNGLPF
jgi:hypothetical protein